MTATPFTSEPAGEVRHAIVATSFGEFTVVADDSAVTAVHFPGTSAPADGSWGEALDTSSHPVLTAAAEQLTAFLDGERTDFDLPLRPQGTDFQRQAWAALLEIPFGQTRSYREQAEAIGRPTAVRAVGAANGRNPIPVVIPCHRVVGSSGLLTGYAGGTELKARLLALESGQQTFTR